MWIRIGCVLLAVGVSMGAFGAHTLRDRLDAYSMAVYEKAVFYHLAHALGILLVAALHASHAISESAAGRTNMMLTFGILIFSGSLYILAITGAKWLGAITPIGGLLFIAAWLLLAFKPQ